MATKDVRVLMRQAQAQRAAAATHDAATAQASQQAAAAARAATAAAAQAAAAGAGGTDRIVSAWVRYNALGHIVCTACYVTIKTELLWPSHAASRKHKEAVAAAGGERSPPAAAPAKAATAPKPSALGALAGYACLMALTRRRLNIAHRPCAGAASLGAPLQVRG